MSGGAMTPEECRAAQIGCSRRVFDEMTALRREVKEDIALIREAVQSVDRAVSSIKGYLGLNGNGADAARPHKRDHEAEEHLHRRITDFLDAQDKLKEQPSKDGITVPRWAAIGLAGFVLIVLAISMIAGERALVTLPKSLPKAPALEGLK